MQGTTEYLEFAKAVAQDAGDIMRKYFGKSPDYEFKTDETIVTIADKEVNSLVIRKVQETYPGHSVDGEEESSATASDHVWVCDPIDGTNPFAMELPVSVFSLALVVDGKPLVGVIYDPFCDKLYAASKGAGAYVNDKPLAVSKDGLTVRSRLNFDWWPEAEYDVLKPLQQLSRDTKTYLLSPGSTTHMAALVAEGAFVASVFPGTKGKNVDIAAAKVIVEEAGGIVTDLFGKEQRYDRPIRGAVVSNGVVHDEVVRYLVNSFPAGGDK
ncbi:MAG: inositol monophosphatase [Candidatus Saccharibacteria bacterium]